MPWFLLRRDGEVAQGWLDTGNPGLARRGGGSLRRASAILSVTECFSSVDYRSGEPLVLAPENPSFHTQVRAILHMSVEHSRVRRVRRPHGAMPSRPMRAQIRLVQIPTRAYAFVRFRDFLGEPFDFR